MTESSNTQSKSKAKYWIIFIVSLVAMVLITIYRPEAFWLPLPIMVTAFAVANDWL
ncbi:MAG: hypothetical protein NTW54_10400 [Bacteroidetes bacterium]|nr:hypothetical protein [Bacteroidota bacterium]